MIILCGSMEGNLFFFGDNSALIRTSSWVLTMGQQFQDSLCRYTPNFWRFLPSSKNVLLISHQGFLVSQHLTQTPLFWTAEPAWHQYAYQSCLDQDLNHWSAVPNVGHNTPASTGHCSRERQGMSRSRQIQRQAGCFHQHFTMCNFKLALTNYERKVQHSSKGRMQPTAFHAEVLN